MEFLWPLRNPEFRVGDFMMPWGMVAGALGFLLAWVLVSVMEHLGWTRHVWQLPIFFVALAVICACALGLILAP
jgi:hypothetical protein